jgi:uncharacterized membrane protein YfcA
MPWKARTVTGGSGNVHSRLLIAALSLAVFFLGVEVIIRIWDLYRLFPPVDLVSHVLAGMAVCAFAYWVVVRREGAQGRKGAILSTLVVALLWEGVELIQERLWPDPPWLEDVFFWDGVFDVIATVAGGFLAFPFLRWLQRTFRTFRPMDL